MSVVITNIFSLPACVAGAAVDGQEVFEPLARGPGLLVERIVSWGQRTPAGQWYEQDTDEWVTLLQGEAALRVEQGGEERVVLLGAGDSVLLPAGLRHRVEGTSQTPPCIWLAVHGSLAGPF